MAEEVYNTFVAAGQEKSRPKPGTNVWNRYYPAGYVLTDATLPESVLPVATTQAAIAAIGNAINTTDKTLYKEVEDENGRIYRALGSSAASKWRPQDDQSGISDITPA